MKLINLKLLRRELGLTQKQFGDKLLLQQSTVSYLENGMQEVTDYLLDRIAQAYGISNIKDYVYERRTFLDFESMVMTHDEKMSAVYDSDWNELTPTDVIEDYPILCKIGRISISRDGTLLIDRNNGMGFQLSHYIIRPEQFEEPQLMLQLTSKSWFDDELYEDFKRAYFIGCKLADIHPMKQIKAAQPI